MSATAQGISDHAAVEIFETWHQRLRRAGVGEHQASRMALYVTYRLSEVFDDAQAWEAVNELLGPQQRSHRHAENDGQRT